MESVFIVTNSQSVLFKRTVKIYIKCTFFMLIICVFLTQNYFKKCVYNIWNVGLTQIGGGVISVLISVNKKQEICVKLVYFKMTH